MKILIRVEFFQALNAIRRESNIGKKLADFAALELILEKAGQVTFDHAGGVEEIGGPSFAAICKIVHGSEVERRRNLDTREGRGIFLHALAHIEYSAIDLALDSAYRFRNLPPQYYEDWLCVAADEARHFVMLRGLLSEIDFDYGSFTVHTGIHDAMVRSGQSLRQRMAATHRHLEANGLDAHPELARKISGFKDPFAGKISAALKIIFDDEITHVHAGDFWFRYACGHEGSEVDVFKRDVVSAIPGTRFGKKNLNVEARRKAGFTEYDLELMAKPE